MSPCILCGCAPVLEHVPARKYPYAYRCPHGNSSSHLRRTDGSAKQGAAGRCFGKTEQGALRSWERIHGTAVGDPWKDDELAADHSRDGDEHCPACGLRGPHACLQGDATARDVGASQWWSERLGHHRYTDEETVVAT